MRSLEFITRVLEMNDLELLTFIRGWFRDEEVITDDINYVYVKNESPLMLVAHIDTVRHGTKVDIKINDNMISNSRGILGADDRAGVYMLLNVYSYVKEVGGIVPQFLFTNFEESFGVGVSQFIKHGHLNKENVKFFIEADRLGRDQYVNYHYLPDPLAKFIESFGYRHAHGSYSDIHNLTATYKIPSVNISVGYYFQHTPSEILNWSYLNESLDKLIRIVENMYNIPEYEYKSIYKYEYDYSTWDDDIPEIIILDSANAPRKERGGSLPARGIDDAYRLSRREKKLARRMEKRLRRR